MTRRQDLERHRHSLGEIREIMNSMKTLAYMETRKLSRFLPAQQAVVTSIEDMAADFLGFYRDSLPRLAETTPVMVLVGSERGFCGDFNQALVRRLTEASKATAESATSPRLIAVGHKLHGLVDSDPRVVALIDGASVVEEVTRVLHQLVRALSELQQRYGALSLSVLHFDHDNKLVSEQLLPPFQQAQQHPPRHAWPPELNLPPQAFLGELVDHYLFAALNELLYTSLMAENHQRVAHLEGAVRHLDDEAEELKHRSNALRQEEIIEEIEVILLSASAQAASPKTSRR